MINKDLEEARRCRKREGWRKLKSWNNV